MSNHSDNLLDFKDPGTIDEELLDVPGFVNQLTDFTLTQAHSPNRTLAMLGATAMLAHLAGRSYADTHGTRTNLYLVALGESGIGKEMPRLVNRKLADAIGTTNAVCDAVASGEALEECLANHPTLLFQTDEAENFFGALRGTGRNAAGLSDRIRRLYSSSAGHYAVRSTAKLPNGTVIAYPHLTMFGTATPDAFYGVLDSRMIANGLFGRCLVVNVPDAYRANIPTEAPIPDDLVDIARWHADNERRITQTNTLDLITVTPTPEAISRMRSSADILMDLRKRLADSELYTARALVVRMNEKIAKLAMLHAISGSPAKPVITGAGVEWAAKFVTHVTKAMLHEAQFHIAEGKFDALIKRTISYLRKNGGSADRSALLRHLHIDAITLKKLVTTLLMCETIESEVVSCGKIVYSLRMAA